MDTWLMWMLAIFSGIYCGNIVGKIYPEALKLVKRFVMPAWIGAMLWGAWVAHTRHEAWLGPCLATIVFWVIFWISAKISRRRKIQRFRNQARGET